MHPPGDLLGKDESEGASVLQYRAYRESQQLLQNVHHMDQRKDSEDLCGTQHV